MSFKPTRRKIMKLRAILIIAAAVCAAVFVLYYIGIFPAFSFSASKIRALDVSLPDNVTGSSNGLLYSQNGELHLMNFKGEEVWRMNLEMADPVTVSSDNVIVNYAGKTLHVMDYTKAQLFSTSLDGEILRAAAGVNTVAVMTGTAMEDGETINYIYLFNLKGEPIGQIDQYAYTTKQVIDFGFHSASDMFWVLSLDTTGIVPISNVNTFKLDGKMTSVITDNTQIIEKVYVTDNSIYCSGTNYLTSYSYFADKQDEQQVYGWRPEAYSIAGQEFRLSMIPRSSAAEIDITRVYATNLANVQMRLPRDVYWLAQAPNRTYAYAQNVVYSYNSQGSLERETPFDMWITKAKQVSDNYVIMWDEQKSYIMELT